MGKPKKTPFSPWETMKPDGIEKRYIRLGDSLLLHPAYLGLNHAARNVLTYMKIESGGKREFTFPKSKYIKVVTIDGFATAKKELINAGFIDEIANNANLRKANIYRFSERWKNG